MAVFLPTGTSHPVLLVSRAVTFRDKSDRKSASSKSEHSWSWAEVPWKTEFPPQLETRGEREKEREEEGKGRGDRAEKGRGESKEKWMWKQIQAEIKPGPQIMRSGFIFYTTYRQLQKCNFILAICWGKSLQVLCFATASLWCWPLDNTLPLILNKVNKLQHINSNNVSPIHRNNPNYQSIKSSSC